MKKISEVSVIGIFLLISTYKDYAQTNSLLKLQEIEPYHAEAAYSNTTNIVFPYPIISVDRGSKDILAQKAKGVENVLQIKAAKRNFAQTNLSVMTGDGRLNSFLVEYSEQPSILNICLTQEENKNGTTILSQGINQREIEANANNAIQSTEKFRCIQNKRFGIQFSLAGLFIKDDVMYMRFNIKNDTYINYDIGQFRCYIRDSRKAKRTAAQEIEIKPLLTYNMTEKVKAKQNRTFIFAVSKFTIPDKKILIIQLMERDGGRHLKLQIPNRKIVQAIPLMY
jgi:conjugative transposon TraN protein